MPKWVGRVAAIAAAVTTGSVAWTSGAQAATTPTISLGSAHTAVSLPTGCRANSFQVTNSPDGSYHGYLQATCDKKGRFFYISRSPSGTWALRSTNIDIQIPLATTTDNTGTYFVGVRSNHDLILVRRNGNGSLSNVHVLDKYRGEQTGFDAASVIASNGNFWATWSSWETGPHDYMDYMVGQARTMAPSESSRTVGKPQWFGPTLVARPGKATQLLGCEASTDYLPDATYSVITANATADDWTLSQQFTNDSCGEGGSGNTAAGYFGGHTYFAMPESGGIYDDRSGAFKLTPLTGMTGSRAVVNLTSGRAAFIGYTKSGETEWLQNTDGTFSAAPTGILSAAPVPVLTDQIINRSGKVIRLFVQHDTVHHLAGTRLLEQIQQ
jgi:hypothetical protein